MTRRGVSRDEISTTEEADWTRFRNRWLGIALLLHLVTAVFSTGYQNADEHYQILEFLSHALGRSPGADLSIEFQRMMRPWLQPFLYWLPTQALLGLGIESPFAWATSYRILSSLIGWASIVFLAEACRVWVRDLSWRKIALVALSLTWFLPALHARHSSENLSGAVFFIALSWAALLVDRPNRGSWGEWIGIGALLGLAFEFRYQVGAMVAGFGAWLIVVARPGGARLAGVAIGGLISLGLGLGLDRLGYGQWVLAPWNYAQFNLLEGRLDAAGVSPWWDYFRRVWTETWPVLAFVNLMGLIVGWIRFPRHALTWAMVPFFLFHLAIGHKETRFLFPMAHAAPVLLVLALSSFGDPASLWRRSACRWGAQGVIAFNLFALVVLCFLPVWFSIRFYAQLEDLARERGRLELFYTEEDPFLVSGIPMNFYRPAGIRTRRLEKRPEGAFFLAHVRPGLPEDLTAICSRKFSAYPEWPRRVAPIDPLRNVRDWTLFECQAPRP